MNGFFSDILGVQNSVKPRIFISYHHAGDGFYYDQFSQTFHQAYEVIHDKSVNRIIDSDDYEYVMRVIREDYITGSSCTIVLVGKDTWRRKYVDWEINATLEKKHALIGLQLPSAPHDAGGRVIVPDRLHDNIESGFARWLSWEYVMTNHSHLERHIAEAKSRSYAYIDNTRPRMRHNA